MPFTFKIRQKIKEAWVLYKEHFGSIILLLLVTGILQIISQKFSKNILVGLLLILISTLISYIWIKSIFNLLDGKGFNPFLQESLPTLSQYWDLIKTSILILLCVIPGIILLIVPGLYISGRLFPAKYISIEKHQGARKNIKEAWELTRGNAWRLLWKSLLIGLFILLGFIALVVGSVITYPIGIMLSVMMYRELVKFKSVGVKMEAVEIPAAPAVEVK